MTHMTRKSIALWTLTWTLAALLLVAWVALAEAGPKATPQATPPTAAAARPVSLARICPRLGEYAAAVAVSRDAGATLSGSLSFVRQEAATQGMDSNLQAILQEIVSQVYRYPAITPRQVQQVAERACFETQTGTTR
jgi:hypothetical protein